MYRWVFIVALFLSCSTNTAKESGLPYYTSADFTPQWLSAKKASEKKIHQIPSFSFTDQSGTNLTEKDLAGKMYVANFFFTSCPGICKRLTNNVMLIQQAFLNDTSLKIVSHSVAPETDSVPKLMQYAQQYGIDNKQWHLLTGNRNELYALARRAYFADEDLGVQQAENDFLHTENVLLIDKQRRIRGIYKGTSSTDMQNLIHDIHLLKKE